MTLRDNLEEAVRRLVETANPQKIILFGSLARNEATEESDLDFLVVERDVINIPEEMVRLRRSLRGMGLSADILVVSERDLGEWGHLPGTVLYTALKEGKVLYENPH